MFDVFPNCKRCLRCLCKVVSWRAWWRLIDDVFLLFVLFCARAWSSKSSELKLFTIWTEDYFHQSFVSHRCKDVLAVFVQSYFPWCAVPVNWLCFYIVWSWSLKLIWTHWSLFLLLVVHRWKRTDCRKLPTATEKSYRC